MNRLKIIITNSYKIFSAPLSFTRRLRVFCAYGKIITRRFFENRLLTAGKPITFVFMGYRVNLDNFSDFYFTFREVFIDNVYYFKTKTKSPFILDLGGNIGVSVIYFKWLYPKAEIKVFEPHPQNIEFLKKTIANNGFKDVEVVEKAVGKTEGRLEIFGDRKVATVKESLITEQNKKSDQYRDKVHKVGITVLSPYVTKRVDFLKMDIEGAESEVVAELQEKGKFSLINKLAMEYHYFSTTENKFSEIVTILETNDFSFWCFYDEYDVFSLPTKKYYNWILLAQRRAE